MLGGAEWSRTGAGSRVARRSSPPEATKRSTYSRWGESRAGPTNSKVRVRASMRSVSSEACSHSVRIATRDAREPENRRLAKSSSHSSASNRRTVASSTREFSRPRTARAQSTRPTADNRPRAHLRTASAAATGSSVHSWPEPAPEPGPEPGPRPGPEAGPSPFPGAESCPTASAPPPAGVRPPPSPASAGASPRPSAGTSPAPFPCWSRAGSPSSNPPGSGPPSPGPGPCPTGSVPVACPPRIRWTAAPSATGVLGTKEKAATARDTTTRSRAVYSTSTPPRSTPSPLIAAGAGVDRT